MPAQTEKQRRFFGAVLGAKKGKPASGKAKAVAKDMSEHTIKDFLHKKSTSDKETAVMNEEYVAGFCQKCAEAGVDAEVLMKSAYTNVTNLVYELGGGNKAHRIAVILRKLEERAVKANKTVAYGTGAGGFLHSGNIAPDAKSKTLNKVLRMGQKVQGRNDDIRAAKDIGGLIGGAGGLMGLGAVGGAKYQRDADAERHPILSQLKSLIGR